MSPPSRVPLASAESNKKFRGAYGEFSCIECGHLVLDLNVIFNKYKNVLEAGNISPKGMARFTTGTFGR